MGALDEIRTAVQEVGNRVGPSVVSVGRAGSGVVIGPGLVATNAHNLRAEEMPVDFADGRSEKGRVAAVDADADLAVLAVETGSAPAVEWGSELPETGAVVFAVARPAGGPARVTFGTVSAVDREFRGPRGRRIAGSVEHTAPLARGSSGGPLADAGGRVLALNTHRLGDGFYLGLPADQALTERLAALARGEAPRRARLGVAIAPPHVARRLRAAVGLEPRDGLLVRGVEEGSAAQRAGLRQGDLIVAVAGTAVTGADDLHQALDGAGPDGSLELRVVRGGDEVTVVVALGPDGGGHEGAAHEGTA
ncbi:MAG TPA: S1C family serine protease [Acidimicrobiales bacterium]|nr:S1C family serine protease [Acidimicrobiales bacterium]